MHRAKGGIGVLLLLSVSLPGSLVAGTLGDFEDAVAKPKSSSSHSDYDDAYDDSVFNDLFGGCFTTIVEDTVKGLFLGVKWLVYDGGTNPGESRYDFETARMGESTEAAAEPVPLPVEEDPFSPSGSVVGEGSQVGEGRESGDPAGMAHRLGTAAVPYVRFDYRRQYLDSDLDANDYLLEAGYRYAAFYGRFTRYEDRAANETLNIEQYYGMLRYGGSDDFFFPGSFQIGAGIGGYVIKGDREQSGAALTFPVMLYPSDRFGIEFRPAWASINDKMISDYDISVSAGQRFIQLRAGYRWLWVQDEGHWLNGPYAGVSLSF